ncbi:hypothetical protein AVEN_59881-1 [Araneus ventricosus]|uniref:Uncharacterized protein n=1 Tax=Araneus ventricosus TaxID=182803 RepID=A0A4Y2GWW0_ARAVE|nr:hypothetical protein AVEN_59881-1 [Araneus ventricosus]
MTTRIYNVDYIVQNGASMRYNLTSKKKAIVCKQRSGKQIAANTTTTPPVGNSNVPNSCQWQGQKEEKVSRKKTTSDTRDKWVENCEFLMDISLHLLSSFLSCDSSRSSIPRIHKELNG